MSQDPLPPQIEHVIVLMMENRSFDHLLGFLPEVAGEGYDKSFDGADRRRGQTRDSRYAIYPGPGHSHKDSMQQILGQQQIPGYPLYHRVLADKKTLSRRGFVKNFERQQWKENRNKGYGKKMMRCFHPAMVPVLSTLAIEYAVCDRWFASLPGNTFPNRDFAVAGSSFGRVENSVKRRSAPSIFSLLHKHGTAAHDTWRLYHTGACHLSLYTDLFLQSHDHARGTHSLVGDIESGDLPTYSFVEPDYGDVIGINPTKFMTGESQHPSQADSLTEFLRGEKLMAKIYDALCKNKAVFNKTVFVITYDEHGGFYDHVPPPIATPPDSARHRSGKGRKRYEFRFDRLGGRVPAVIVSPWIRKGRVDHTIYDHTSIIQTLRRSFAPRAAPLGNRDAFANTFSHLLSLDTPRSDLPAVQPLSVQEGVALQKTHAAGRDDGDNNRAPDLGLLSKLGKTPRIGMG